jgi:Reverse transcriptase (RNA-dependent DNA polymerase)
MQRIGVHGEFLQGVQALYADVPLALQFEGGMSETFQCTLGVKQGRPLSLTLFGIHSDDFQAELAAAGGDLDLPTLCGVQAPALFYADELDLVSTSVRGLQAQLDLLESYCKRWRLTVNVKKTKVVVYAAQAAAPPVLTYMHAPIEGA